MIPTATTTSMGTGVESSSCSNVRDPHITEDPHTASVMGTWGSLISLREMVTPIPISLVILGWGSP